MLNLEKILSRLQNFGAQSIHYDTNAKIMRILDIKTIYKSALDNQKQLKAHRFFLVASGKGIKSASKYFSL